jgi:trehalose-phosphatase
LARLKPLWGALEAIAERLRRAPRLLLATDFDGTLTPIVEHPGLATLDPRTRRVLARFTRQPDVEVAVLSGRPVRDLSRRVRLSRAFLSGSAGLETREPGERTRSHVPPARAVPEALRRTLGAWCARFDGAWVENKRLSIAVHYRGVPARFQPAFGAGVRRRVSPHRDRVLLVHGKKVFELMPDVEVNKATALERWADSRHGGLLVFLGDDTHDEPVHARVRSHGGIAIAIGRKASRAEFALDHPRAVTWFLEWLLREWRAQRGAPEGARRDPDEAER